MLSDPPFYSHSMRSHPAYKEAGKTMAPLLAGISTWGVVTGVAMVKAGMPPGLAILMSLTVNAGSAQLAALPLMMSDSPIWIILLAGLCVNLRFVIFSLQLRPYFLHFSFFKRVCAGYLCGDMTFVLFIRRFSNSTWCEEQMPYFWGLVTSSWSVWQCSVITGALLGELIPMSWGIQFAATLAILAVVFTMLDGWITWITMFVSAIVVVFLKGVLPFDLNIVAGIAFAVAVALMAEKVQYRWRRLRQKQMRQPQEGGPGPEEPS